MCQKVRRSKSVFFLGRIKPEVVAPGVNNVVASINSPTAYSRNSGTSFATPIVAGIAALIVQAHPDWTNLMVRIISLLTLLLLHM